MLLLMTGAEAVSVICCLGGLTKQKWRQSGSRDRPDNTPIDR
jgi:hypothetical protein